MAASLFILLTSASVTPPLIRPTSWTASDDFNWGSTAEVPQGPGGGRNILVIPSTVDGLVLTCNASYPVEWVFHHSQLPSHAVQRSSRGRWLTVVSTTRKSDSLYDEKNFEYIADIRFMGLSNAITGNYTCQKVGSEFVSESVYVFWEGTSPPFLTQQGQNNTAVLDTATNSSVLLCTVAKPDVLVALYKFQTNGSTWTEIKKGSGVEYDSKKGFTLTNLPEMLGKYKCVANSDEKDFTTVHVIPSNSPEAKPLEFNDLIKRPAFFGYNKQTQQLFCCSRSTAPKLMHFYCDHPVTCRMRKNALLNMENTSTRNSSCSSVRLFLQNAGIFRCQGDGIDIVREYFFPMGFQFGFGGMYNRNRTAEDPYFSWKAADPSKMISLRYWAKKIYVGQNITFGCQVSSYYFSRGVRWAIGWKNGSHILVKEALVNDTRTSGPVQWFRRNINSLVVTADLNLTTIGCYAPVWNTSEWKSQNVTFAVLPSIAPKILGSAGVEIIEWYVNDTNKYIQCSVFGDPVPSVTWKKDDKFWYKYFRSTSNETSLTSRINVTRVSYGTHGEYVCTAKNVGGIVSKTYKVLVHEKSSSGVVVVIVISMICLVLSLTGIAYLVMRMKNQRDIINKLAVSAFKDVDVVGNTRRDPPDPIFDFNTQNVIQEDGFNHADAGSYRRM